MAHARRKIFEAGEADNSVDEALEFIREVFVGTETAGKNIAGLYSSIATCDAHGVNPLEYLADVRMFSCRRISRQRRGLLTVTNLPAATSR